MGARYDDIHMSSSPQEAEASRLLSEAWVRYIAGNQGFIVNKGGINHTITGTATQSVPNHRDRLELPYLYRVQIPFPAQKKKTFFKKFKGLSTGL